MNHAPEAGDEVELKHLTSFVAVASQLSFVRAANQLHISQPALSGQIQKLEEELGVQLFERNRRVVKLTEVGKVFLADATSILHQTSRAAERVQKASRGEIGRLRIGFVSSAALTIVPHLVVEFRKQKPEVALDLINLRTVSQVKRLLGKTLDVGFIRLPLSHDLLEITVIHREKFAIVLPKEHRLAEANHLPIAQLRNEPFIAYARRWAPGFFDSIMQMCTREGFSPNIVQETGEMYTAIALVAAGAGIAILPESVVLAQPNDIAVRPIPASMGLSEIAIATKVGNNSSVVRSFISIAHEICKICP